MPETSPVRASADKIAGQYQLRPGRQPGVTGGRPVLDEGVLTRLLRGKTGTEATRNLGAVFTLCAHAHRRTSALALSVALNGAPAPSQAPPDLPLCLETARDHLRSMALDWMRRLPDAQASTPDLAWLKDCPLALVAKSDAPDNAWAFDQLTSLKAWLEDRLLGEPVAQWLDAHAIPEVFAAWCHAQASRLPPARYLSQWYTAASAMHITANDLDILNQNVAIQSTQLTELAHALVTQAHFAQFPTWRGQCAENGPWTRLRHRTERAQHSHAPRSVWSRMAARWLELLEIVHISTSDHSAMPLSNGALELAPGQAIAWCEMARGLLMHWVQLDGNGHVQDYRVLAPTEWNFHPQGALAQTVAALSPRDHHQALLLADAFDPCVGCTVEP